MSILELLQKAKKLYLENQGKVGMCWCIKVIANQDKHPLEQSRRGQVPYASIVAQIPEFNPEFFNAKPRRKWVKSSNVGLEFWWDVECVEPRIKAFDILIELYENIDKR